MYMLGVSDDTENPRGRVCRATLTPWLQEHFCGDQRGCISWSRGPILWAPRNKASSSTNAPTWSSRRKNTSNPSPPPKQFVLATISLRWIYQATSEDKPVSQSFLRGLPALLVRPPAGKRFPNDLLSAVCSRVVANGIAVSSIMLKHICYSYLAWFPFQFQNGWGEAITLKSMCNVV